jgi:glycerophosphoryl diester phosphodiesterase
VAPGSSERPLVIGHRGAPAAEPEHTLAGYLRALDDNADGVECDVRLTRDGHLVCLHDRLLARVSDGRGAVSEHTLAELEALDFSCATRDYPDRDVAERGANGDSRGRVLTLEALIHTLRDAGRPVHLFIETKHPNRYGAEVEQRLMALLRCFGLDGPHTDAQVRVTLMSFSVFAVRRMRAMAPRLPVVMLLEVVPPGLRRGWLPAGAGIAGPGVALLRAQPALAPRLITRGHAIYVWTVNTADDLDVALGAGAAAVISDRPAFIHAELGRRPAGGAGRAA